jgi:16S rRNA (uracil1498-N3)-methyltransferase
MKNQHEFAIHFPILTPLIANSSAQETLKIEDADLVHRIERVLRLKESEAFVLFDQYNHARCVLQKFENRRTMEVFLLEVGPNQALVPELLVWLPVLKRDDLEEAIYSMVELGVNVVQLLLSGKVQRAWGGPRELERLQRIIIAAAEQSKNFAYPDILEPISFDAFLQKRNAASRLLFFDVGGKSLFEVITALRVDTPAQIEILIGPEGDLSPDEKKALQNTSTITCALTPTILRARQAIALGVGAIRSAF